MTRISPTQHFTGHDHLHHQHQPSCLSNGQGQKLEDTISRTARVPPPKLLPSAVRCTDSFTANAQLPTQVCDILNV